MSSLVRMHCQASSVKKKSSLLAHMQTQINVKKKMLMHTNVFTDEYEQSC